MSGVVCAVLAAGASRRLGQPKQLVLHEGQPLLRRTVEVARRSSCTRVAVVLGAEADGIAPMLATLDVDLVMSPGWREGLSSSIRAAVAWARSRQAIALLLTVGDQLDLTSGHLDDLVIASGAASRTVASAYDGILGAPALFPATRFAELTALTGDHGARSLLRHHDDVVSVPWPAGNADLDTPADLQRLRSA